MLFALIFLSQLKVKSEAINKIMFVLLIIKGIINETRIFLITKFFLQPNFETRSRMRINLYIMGQPFRMYIIMSIHTEILS